MITVVNKYKHEPTDHDVYIGRGSVFGNPYSHLDSSHHIYKVDTREEAIRQFKIYFDREATEGTRLYNQLMELKEKAENEDINLVCFCKPKACHGDVIKKWLDNKLKKDGRE